MSVMALRTILLVGVLLLGVGLSTQAVTVRALTLYDSGDPTSAEQLVLEYINRARADPWAEGTRLSLSSITEGLSSQDASYVGVRPPLAMNSLLLGETRAYSQYEYAHDCTGHYCGGGNPGTRMTGAGYTPLYLAGENVAWGSSGYSATALEDFLMIDSTESGRGHRINLLDIFSYAVPPCSSPPCVYYEVGIGWYTGASPNPSGYSNFLTQDFGASSTGPFLVGVVYNDANSNNFYDIGEGLSGVTITPSAGSYYAVSSTSGGYAIPIGTSGSITVTATSSSFGTVSKTVSLTGANVKQDFKKKPVSTIRISTNTYDSLFPSVAASGSYVYVAWQDDTPVAGSGTNPEIWMRVSNNNGGSFGSAIRISTNTGISENPSVAASGNYVYVAWDDDTSVTGSGGNPEIWMRASANNAASFGSPIRITTNTYDSLYPSVAASGSYVYVAWQDDTPVTGSGSNPEIWMRASPNYGASFGSAIRITTNYGSSEDPSVAASGSYVYVAWDDDTFVTGSGGDSEIWVRVSGNNGVSFGSAMRITTNTGKSVYPSVAADGSYVYVAWHDWTAVTGSGTWPEIWLRASSNNGVGFGSAVRITTNTGASGSPSVTALGNYAYVAWMDWTPVPGSGSDYEIWMRVSGNNGGSFGSAIRVSTNTGFSGYPSVAASGSYLYVAWDDNTPVSGSGSAYEIWMRVSS